MGAKKDGTAFMSDTKVDIILQSWLAITMPARARKLQSNVKQISGAYIASIQTAEAILGMGACNLSPCHAAQGSRTPNHGKGKCLSKPKQSTVR